MDQYHKIQTVYKRDMENKGRIMLGVYALPEFEYLRSLDWVWTEKVDGTNVRVQWKRGVFRWVQGKTAQASMPVFLLHKLEELFSLDFMDEVIQPTDEMCLYGEGYGRKIQKGDKYKSDGVDFVLFDVKVGGWWLQREDVESVGRLLNTKVVPIVGTGSLDDAVALVERGFKSQWGDFTAEGLVMKPAVELRTRSGERIVAKIKHKDFN